MNKNILALLIGGALLSSSAFADTYTYYFPPQYLYNQTQYQVDGSYTASSQPYNPQIGHFSIQPYYGPLTQCQLGILEGSQWWISSAEFSMHDATSGKLVHDYHCTFAAPSTLSSPTTGSTITIFNPLPSDPTWIASVMYSSGIQNTVMGQCTDSVTNTQAQR